MKRSTTRTRLRDLNPRTIVDDNTKVLGLLFGCPACPSPQHDVALMFDKELARARGQEPIKATFSTLDDLTAVFSTGPHCALQGRITKGTMVWRTK